LEGFFENYFSASIKTISDSPKDVAAPLHLAFVDYGGSFRSNLSDRLRNG
jgi:hypothetical protein